MPNRFPARVSELISADGAPACRAAFGVDAITADADGATVTFDLTSSNFHKVTLGGNRTLAFSNDQDGQTFKLLLTQDATGSRTVTWPAGIKWAGGSAPTLTTTANKGDLVTIHRLASGSYLGTVNQNF